MISLGYINFWKDSETDDYLTNFITYHFGEVKVKPPSQNPDILVCSVFGNVNAVKKIKSQIKIFYYGENLERREYNQFKTGILNSLFDIIAGFHGKSHGEKFVQFPLWLFYHKFYDVYFTENIIDHIERTHSVNRKTQKSFANFCVLIARHDKNGIRKRMYDIVSEFGSISCPGKLLNNTKTITNGTREKKNYMKKYIFNICPENSATENYVTEKLFEALESGCVPIYWGHDIPRDIIRRNKILFLKSNFEKKDFQQYYASMSSFEGPVFTEKAFEIINKYYIDFVESIQSKLLQTHHKRLFIDEEAVLHVSWERK